MAELRRTSSPTRALTACALFLAGAVSCASAPDSEAYAERVVVFMEATVEDLEALSTQVPPEDFATIADDLMFYRAEALSFLEREGWPVVTLQGRRSLDFVVNGETHSYDFAELPTLDAIVLFEPGQEPKGIAPIDVSAAREYFGAGG